MRDATRHTQKRLAGMFGVSQQCVAKWIDKPKIMRNTTSGNAP